MKPNIVPIESLKKGDRFTEHGGAVFELLEDPRPSFSHGPDSGFECGPPDVVYAACVTISGEVSGYFKTGTEWALQGRVNMVRKTKV